MSESLWKSEVMEEALPEEQAEPIAEQVAEVAAELAAEASVVTLSVDEFSALEERIQRTVNLVKFERQARATAEERVITLQTQLREQAPLAEQLQKEISALREERAQVRQRVERILSQLDALEL
jgi:PHD/YefM family antitoxin component YafN of YafNO toxin-antitoxin module